MQAHLRLFRSVLWLCHVSYFSAPLVGMTLLVCVKCVVVLGAAVLWWQRWVEKECYQL